MALVLWGRKPLEVSAPIMGEICTRGFHKAGFLFWHSMLGISTLMALIQWPQGLLSLLTTGVKGMCSDILQDVSQLLNLVGWDSLTVNTAAVLVSTLKPRPFWSWAVSRTDVLAQHNTSLQCYRQVNVLHGHCSVFCQGFIGKVFSCIPSLSPTIACFFRPSVLQRVPSRTL